MPRLASLVPSSVTIRLALVAAFAFSIGATTVAAAGPTIAGFVGLIDGANTAAINPSRELSVTDAGAQAALVTTNSRLAGIDARLASPQPITGSVAITNTPTVNVATMPSVSIAGTPAVSIVGTPSVSINGTPSVSISGTPTVQSGDSTALVFHQLLSPNGQTSASFSNANVGAYKTIRVYISCFGTSQCADVIFTMWDVDQSMIGQLDAFQIASGATNGRVYDVPGTNLQMFAATANQAPLNNMLLELKIFGRKN